MEYLAIGFWVIVIVVKVLGKYMIIWYWDLSGLRLDKPEQTAMTLTGVLKQCFLERL